ncbi:MAG TPA: acetate--CoA ligase family protein [Natronosporangium sp.]
MTAGLSTITGTDHEGPTRAGLASLLSPRSVALVGASDDVTRFGGAAVHNLLSHGYRGEVYFVSRTRSDVAGRPAYRSVADLPGPVDSAVLLVAADAAIEVAAHCRAAGVRSLVIVASGFGEGGSGQAGRDRLARLREVLAGSGITVLGPSTTGVSNLLDGYLPRASGNQLPATAVRGGPLALVSQSGAVNNIIYNRAQSRGVGVGYAVATGLQAFCDVWDVAGFVLEDDRIRVVAMVLEDAGPAGKAVRVCRRARELGKPVLVVKLGRTARGAAAVAAHSGSLAGEWAVQEAVLTEAGATVVADFDQLWELPMLLTAWGPPAATAGPPRLGVLAFSGGEGALIADQAAETGLRLPPLSDRFQAALRERSPLAEAGNPFDPTGDVIGREEQFVESVRSFVADNDFDAYLLAAPIQGELLRGPMRRACQAARATGRPVAASLWTVPGLSDGVAADLRADGVPLFDTSHRALAAIERYVALTAPPAGPAAPPQAAAPAAVDRLRALPPDAGYWQVRDTLANLGVPFPPAGVFTDPAAAAEYAAATGFPVVAKGDVASTVHKSKAGLVRLGLRDRAAVVAATRELLELTTRGGRHRPPRVVIEAYAFGELQVYCGGKRDPEFGPVVLFGTGGSAVEFAGDTAVAPAAGLSPAAARRLVGQTRIGGFIAGRDPALADRLAALVTVVATAMHAGGVTAIDLNPVVVDLTGGTLSAVDARVVTAGSEPASGGEGG